MVVHSWTCTNHEYSARYKQMQVSKCKLLILIVMMNTNTANGMKQNAFDFILFYMDN